MIDTAESLYERYLRDIIPIYEAIHDKAKDTMREIVLNKFDVPESLLRDLTMVSGNITDHKFRHRVLKEAREAREKREACEKSEKSTEPTNQCSDSDTGSTKPSTGLSETELIKSIEDHISKYPNKSPNNYYLSTYREIQDDINDGIDKLVDSNHNIPPDFIIALTRLKDEISRLKKENRLANEAHDKRDADKDVPYVSTK